MLGRSQQPGCLLGNSAAPPAGCACEVTVTSVPPRPVAGAWLLAVLVRSQPPKYLLGQWQAPACWLCLGGHSSLRASEASGRLLAAGCACEVTAASVSHRLVAIAPPGCPCEITATSVPPRPVAGSWLLAVLVRSQQPQCLLGNSAAPPAGCACGVTAA